MQLIMIGAAVVLFALAGILLYLRLTRKFNLIPLFVRITVIAAAITILLLFGLFLGKK